MTIGLVIAAPARRAETRQSIILRFFQMDARVKPGHDDLVMLSR